MRQVVALVVRADGRTATAPIPVNEPPRWGTFLDWLALSARNIWASVRAHPRDG